MTTTTTRWMPLSSSLSRPLRPSAVAVVARFRRVMVVVKVKSLSLSLEFYVFAFVVVDFGCLALSC
jgi:hypothetical protein